MSTPWRQVLRLAVEDGRRLCEELYWSPTGVRPLNADVDANFLVHDGDGMPHVLKVASPSTDVALLALQNGVLERLEAAGLAQLPRVVCSRAGRKLEILDGGAGFRVRMLTYLPGHLLADLPSRPPRVLEQLGGLLARIDSVLGGLREPAARRSFEWDIARLEERRDVTAAIEANDRRRQAQTAIDDYLAWRRTARGGLRRGLIHCDANEHNVLVTTPDPETAELAGLIDFGDLVESDLVVEPAVAMAYAGIESEDPWATALPLLEGYDRRLPLTDAELIVLFPAVCARLALSVSLSARRLAAGQADAYTLISQAPAWLALERLTELGAEEALRRARAALDREVRTA